MDEKQKISNKSKNSDEKCFQYAITAPLNHGNIGKYLQRITGIRLRDINRTKSLFLQSQKTEKSLKHTTKQSL